MGAARMVGVRARLWLVRHGATAWSEAGRLTGWTDVPLSPAGREQARALGRRLAARSFDGVWTSDLTRAAETAGLAWGEAIPDRRLREVDFGALEGMRWEELSAEDRERLIAFEGLPGGERVADLRRRVRGFLDALGGGRHLVFTHGGVIRLLLRERGCDRAIPPASVTVVSREV